MFSSTCSLSVSVRDLIHFVLQSGDLGASINGGRERNAALEGLQGHRFVQSLRPEHYEAEVSLSYELNIKGCSLVVRGRVDGIWNEPSGFVIEEIKTYAGERKVEPVSIHWSQAKVYAWILCVQKEEPRDQIPIQLTYMHRKTRCITVFKQDFSQEELKFFFEHVTTEYVEWMQWYLDWGKRRDEALNAFTFPYSSYRDGQREFAISVYRALCKEDGRLFAEAPTGIGKTVAALFPATKAMGEGHFSKIFYLTAKTIGRTVAEKALRDLCGSGAKLRSVTLTAKEKICFTESPPCDPELCPYALGYYDRLKPAIQAVFEQEEALTREQIELFARKYQLCPFEFSLDLSLWADVIICDYNYVFDPKVYLKRYFADESGDYAFLIDESHNLADRARSMFSTQLDKRLVLDAKREMQKRFPKCAKALHHVNKFLVQERKLCEEESSMEISRFAKFSRIKEEKPDDLIQLLRSFLFEMEEVLGQQPQVDDFEWFWDVFFQAHDFVKIAGLYDSEFYRSVFSGEKKKEIFSLWCLDPSSLLKEALKRSKAAVFFTATFSPIKYFRYLLGGDDEDLSVQFSSPFPSENLEVFIADRIATTYRAREQSSEKLVETIVTFVHRKKGNYMIFFPSYHYMTMIQKMLEELHPEFEVMVQRSGMKEEEREGFLAAFDKKYEKTLLAFVVMGGIFGEGIDLVGERLIGAVVVGVGLPQLSLYRDLIRNLFEQKSGQGFDYAYMYPGMNRVLQAAGRVIRTEEDRGMILLVDRRFSQLRYRELFPPWWQCLSVRNLEQKR